MPKGELSRHGRPIRITYRRERVTVVVGLMAPALAAMGYFLVTIPETYSRYAMAHLVGYLTFPFAVYVLLLAWRVATWPRLYTKIGRRTLEFPAVHGLFTKQIELDLRDLEDVGFVSSRGGTSSAVWSGGKRYGVPSSPWWLPEGWSADELSRRISLRWRAAQLGLSGPQLAAVEAAWADESVGGVAVGRRGKKWKLLATVEGEEDFARQLERGRIDPDAELILADEVMPEWRVIRDAIYLPKKK